MKMFSAALSMHCAWELKLPDAEPPVVLQTVCVGRWPGPVPAEACGISWDPCHHPMCQVLLTAHFTDEKTEVLRGEVIAQCHAAKKRIPGF